MAGPALGAALVRRTTGTVRPFSSVAHVAHFVLWGVVLHGIVVATVGVSVGVAGGAIVAADAAGSWWRWTLSDAGGTFLFGPALLLWWDGRLRITKRQWLEGGAVSVVALGFAAALFFGVRADSHPSSGLPYLLLVPLMWLTVRCSLRAGATLLSAVAMMALTGTIADAGPFHLLGAERPLLGVGLMVVAMGISTLVVGALVSERHAADERLRELNESLEQRIAERTAELHRRATCDGLTGLTNRGHFFELGEAALERARSEGRPLSALLIDLDRLKDINDTFGHGVGDAAIVELASACSDCLRKGDVLGRIGGDEFAVLLPDGHGEDAEAVARRITEHLERLPAREAAIRASIGWAELTSADQSLDDLLARADAAMYGQKRRRCRGEATTS
ncbi:MAG: diguanylate cyclase [Thiohalomonadaceae bacterium]